MLGGSFWIAFLRNAISTVLMLSFFMMFGFWWQTAALSVLPRCRRFLLLGFSVAS